MQLKYTSTKGSAAINSTRGIIALHFNPEVRKNRPHQFICMCSQWWQLLGKTVKIRAAWPPGLLTKMNCEIRWSFIWKCKIKLPIPSWSSWKVTIIDDMCMALMGCVAPLLPTCIIPHSELWDSCLCSCSHFNHIVRQCFLFPHLFWSFGHFCFLTVMSCDFLEPN